MQAFEFQTTVQDGYIRIPDNYVKTIPQKIKVIVLAESASEKKLDPFPFFGVDTTGYVFDREDANAR